MQKPTLFLIDGMSCAYRAYYAIPGLRASSGEPTNAVYGFTAMLLKIIRERKPDAVAVLFDSRAPTFRHERFEAYKAQRKPMPEDLGDQLPVIKEVIDAYRIRRCEKEGYEADDLMASMAVTAARRGYDVYLVTSDKDLLQLVGENIKVFKPEGGGVYDADAVEKKFGVEPEGIVDILALAGDSSDNVPGVPGIGEKTAIKLVAEFGGLEGVLKNVDEVKGEKRRENLRRFADQARLSRELVLVKKDVPLDLKPEECRMEPPDNERVAELFGRLEFKKLQADVARVENIDDRDYRTIGDDRALDALVDELAGRGKFSFYLVISPRDPLRGNLEGISFAGREREGWYVPFTGPIAEESVVSRLRPLFEREDVAKTCHDIKTAIRILRSRGITLRGSGFDTMLAAYLLNPSKGRYALDDLALELFGVKFTPAAGGSGEGEKGADIPDIALDVLGGRACESADMVSRAERAMLPLLESHGMLSLLTDIEIPLAAVLADMEEKGVRVDTGLLQGLSVELGAEMEKLRATIYSMAGGDFNINSPSQLGAVLFEKLGLPASRKTKRGYSTDYETLRKLARLHPLPASVIEYRRLSKLKSTYLDALPRMVDPRTGRIHTSFHQTGTATGRLSSSDPNLQNIPVRTGLGRKIRDAFLPGDAAKILLSADYSQIDLRLLAHLSGDEEMKAAFERGEDIHARTAAAVFDVRAGDVTHEMRRRAKTINFGIVYGMGAQRLARDLNIGRAEAQGFIDRYFDRYPRVRGYIEKCLAGAEELGYVTTILNRRRYVPQLASGSRATREFGKRIAINTPIQGSSADLIKVAMIEIQREIVRGGWDAAMLLQIHDELLFEVARGSAREFGKMVREKMEGVADLRVPLVARIKTGENWGEL